ncbi:MAG: SurA N-terminal domain-containing protein [Desulfobacterales bacterium]
MRKHAGSWMIKVLLGGVAITFISWGGYQYTSQRLSRVAMVNGETITIGEYNTAYKRLVNQVRQSFGNNLNEELLKSLQLEHKALDQLVDNILMRQAASDLDIRVTDEDLSRSIRSISAFQVAGAFNPRRYQLVLNQNNLTPESFEHSQRDALLIQKLNNFITGSVKVSDKEALEWFRWNNAMVDINYFLLEPDRYKDISVTDEEVQQYFDGHKDDFKTDPAVKVRYLKFDPKNYAAQVKVSDEEIKAYYDEHPSEFQNPKTVEARHILIKVDPNASPEDVAKAKERIENILQKAKNGQDFAELAKQFSEGPSRDKGGYLGTFRREAMVKPFSDKAFSMKAGEISDPVRTQFGWHIIKVEKVNEATTTSLADAKQDIRKKLAEERAKYLAYDAAEAIFDDVFQGSRLEAIAAERQLTLHTTDFFTRQNPPEGAAQKAEFAKVAFELPEGEASEPKDFGDGYYIMEVVEKRPAQIPEFKAVEQKVKADLIKEKQAEKAKQDAEAVLAALKDGVSVQEAGRQFDLESRSTGFFKRDEAIPNIGYESEISRTAFSLSDKNKLPGQVLKGRKGFYVIEFAQRKEPDPAAFEKEKPDIQERLLQQKRFMTFEAWLEQVKNRSEIVIEKDFLKS